MFNTTNGLILREVHYKEADRILTVLTASNGKITAKARGALRKGSRTGAATQLLTYSNLTLFGNRGKWTVNEGSTVEDFAGLRTDIESFALANYFAECLDAMTVEDEPDEAVLQLGLNCLYALSRHTKPAEQIKAVFELRLMCLAGYTPELNSCAVCGDTEIAHPMLGLKNGTLSCRDHAAGASAALTPQTLAAMRFIINAAPKQILSFNIEGEALKNLAAVCEQYLIAQTERRFNTLDYWKQVKI